MHGVAEALRAKGDYARALAVEEKALAMREKVYGPEEGDVAESLVSIGETQLAQGSAPAAAAALERALSILEKEKGDPMDVATAKFDLARAIASSDPPRSRTLAIDARATFASQKGELAKTKVAAVDVWDRARR
jgi:tetratricopeptide (TPR) repeat protein